MPTLPFYLVDAFVRGGRAFTGNGAGVVLLPAHGGGVSDAAMQAAAAEIKQSETAFVRPLDAPHAYTIRWFTPTTEVPLCGHATLAAAAALVAAGRVAAPASVTFDTRESGRLAVDVTVDADGEPRYVLDLPLRAPTDAPPACVDGDGAPLVRALVAGSSARVAAAPRYNAALQYAVVVLEGATEDAARAAVESLTPDAAALEAAAPAGVSGLIATARAGDGTIYSRFWGPWLGIFEDPVTGSAHAVLAPLWLGASGRGRAEQVSARGGELSVQVDGDRVRVGGAGKVVVRGDLCL